MPPPNPIADLVWDVRVALTLAIIKEARELSDDPYVTARFGAAVEQYVESSFHDLVVNLDDIRRRDIDRPGDN